MKNASTYNRRIRRIPTISQFPIMLEIGCGDAAHRSKKHIGLDIIDYGQEFVWNIEEGIPLPDNSVSHIHCSHVLEHLEDLIGVINEMHRVLIPGGELYAIVPSQEHEKAYVPSHIRVFTKWTFDFFQYESYVNEYQSSLWEINELVINERKDIHCKMTPVK
jgi:predicted SAM-dependent methyltransferase